MALTISESGSNNSTTSSATLVVTSTGSFAVGDMVVVCIGSDNQGGGGASSISSVTDSKSHTYTLRATQNQDPGTASSGATVAIYTAPVTAAMTTSDTVTVNFSPNTVSKAAVVWKVVAGTTEFSKYLSNGGTTGATANPSLASTSIGSGDAVIYALAAESNATLTGDSDTTNGNWSTLYTSLANTGTSATSMRVGSQNKVTSATGTQTWNTTLTAADWAISYIVLDPAPRIDRTATGSGTGSQSDARLITRSRTATGTSSSSESADDQLIHNETATGSGVGTSNVVWNIISGNVPIVRTATGNGTSDGSGDVDLVHIRTATGSGVGTATVNGRHIHDRSATGAGNGSAVITVQPIPSRTATGSGVGSALTDSSKMLLRSANGSGTSTSTLLSLVIHYVSATGSGVGTSTAIKAIQISRTGSGSGVGSTGSTVGVVVKVRSATASGSGSASAVSEYQRARIAVGVGVGSSVSVAVIPPIGINWSYWGTNALLGNS